MCGIVGIAGTRDCAPIILDALKRLEYRGYDSAGIATLVEGRIDRRRAPGKLSQAGRSPEASSAAGHTGIGHTRWATHGKPSEINAHPHATERVAVVHNGIIENFRELRADSSPKATSSNPRRPEVCAHLVTDLLDHGMAPEELRRRR